MATFVKNQLSRYLKWRLERLASTLHYTLYMIHSNFEEASKTSENVRSLISKINRVSVQLMNLDPNFSESEIFLFPPELFHDRATTMGVRTSIN